MDWPMHRHPMARCANRKVAGWGPRAQRQTKSVWHSARNGPIACILHGAEKAPGSIWGAFSAPDGKEGGEEMAGGVLTQLGLARYIVLDIHRPSHGRAEGPVYTSLRQRPRPYTQVVVGSYQGVRHSAWTSGVDQSASRRDAAKIARHFSAVDPASGH